MLLLSHLDPVTSEELQLGHCYILLSAAQEKLYILRDSDIEYNLLFGRPENYGLYSCEIEEVELSDSPAYFHRCEIDGMFKHDPMRGYDGDLAIDWSR